MPPPAEPGYRFGPYRFDTARRLLFRGLEAVSIPPKTADLLLALLERRGEVVAKSDLMRLVWPDCVVEEIGLARNISMLRKALGDDADSYIETVPKRGYRFAAEPATTPPPSVSALPKLRLTAVALVIAAGAGLVYWQFYRSSPFVDQTGPVASLAVIPVHCLTPDLDRDGFPQAFTGSLVEELIKLQSVQVTSPSTVQRYRRLGIPTSVMTRLLGLDAVVEGTAQRSGEAVKVSLRLSDVHSGKLIWADGYELAAPDLAAQSRVAKAAAEAVGHRLSRGRQN